MKNTLPKNMVRIPLSKIMKENGRDGKKRLNVLGSSDYLNFFYIYKYHIWHMSRSPNV